MSELCRNKSSVRAENLTIEALDATLGVRDSHTRSLPRVRLVCEIGQSAVEFALVAVVLFILMIGVMDFGIVIYDYSLVSYAANDAARWASVHGATYRSQAALSPATATAVLNHVTAANPWTKTLGATATCPPDETSNVLEVCTQWPTNEQPGSIVEVQIQYNFPLSVPFMNPVTLPLTASTQMVISQ